MKVSTVILCNIFIGTSWIYGITKAHNNIYNGVAKSSYKKLNCDKNVIRTCRGTIPLSLLRPNRRTFLPTDTGSRVGVMYIPTNEYEADMHFIINGEDQGPCVKHIPYREAPLHVVVDVYGATTKVKIVQLYGGCWFFKINCLIFIYTIFSL